MNQLASTRTISILRGGGLFPRAVAPARRFPGAGSGRGAPFDFGGFDFSEPSAAEGADGVAFRDIFSNIFRSGATNMAARAGARSGSGVQVKRQFLGRCPASRLALNVARQDTCTNAPQKKWDRWALPGMHGSGQVTQSEAA